MAAMSGRSAPTGVRATLRGVHAGLLDPVVVDAAATASLAEFQWSAVHVSHAAAVSRFTHASLGVASGWAGAQSRSASATVCGTAASAVSARGFFPGG